MPRKFETIAIHAGQEPDPTTGAVVTPIYATSTYVQEAPGVFTHDYSRTVNPTRTALETALAAESETLRLYLHPLAAIQVHPLDIIYDFAPKVTR